MGEATNFPFTTAGISVDASGWPDFVYRRGSCVELLPMIFSPIKGPSHTDLRALDYSVGNVPLRSRERERPIEVVAELRREQRCRHFSDDGLRRAISRMRGD